jgi:formate--tetrahydrofolate ligase
VIDMNDRALRSIVVGLGGPGNGFPREDGFDIVVASEVMAIFCLATSLQDLKERLATSSSATPATRSRSAPRPEGPRRDGGAAEGRDQAEPGADAGEQPGHHARRPVCQHRPWLQLRHATKAALKLGDYVVTEAGFGADLGAEKFIDIKCRKSGLRPDAVVIVATVRALKYHGGVDLKDLNTPDPAALEKGLANLERHVDNIRHRLRPALCRVDQPLHERHRGRARPAAPSHGPPGRAGGGGPPLGRRLGRCRGTGAYGGPAGRVRHGQMRFVYEDEDSLWDKMKAIATQVYGASDISADSAVRARIARSCRQDGYGHYPVCVAKTQYSFSTDPRLRGAPSGHMVNIREVRLAAGAEFVVMICGDIMTMPGLPKEPASARIDIDDEGRISGLF